MLKYRLRSENLDAGWGLLFKILLLDTVKALVSKRIATLSFLTELRGNLTTLGSWKPWESQQITQWHCCNCSRPSGCSSSSSSSFDLFYVTTFWGLAFLYHQEQMQEPSPGTAQPLSVCWCRGCLSNDKTPSLSWDMGAWPVLQPPFWTLTS